MRWASDNGEQHDQSASLPRSPPCLPRLPALANTSALLASKDARVRIHFQQLCAQPGPPTHPRATVMLWASESGEQHDQCASLPRTQPCLPRLPALANTCALLSSHDARVRIHFKQLARDLDHPRTHAPPLCVGPVTTESSPTSPPASRAPHHACPDSPHWQTQARYLPATTRALIHFKQFARDLDHPRTHAPPLCVGPVTTENSPTSPQASRAPHHACPDSPHWQTQARYLQASSARSDPLPATLRATWTTRTPTRHHYALGQ
jgi:hypothetical protein